MCAPASASTNSELALLTVRASQEVRPSFGQSKPAHRPSASNAFSPAAAARPRACASSAAGLQTACGAPGAAPTVHPSAMCLAMPSNVHVSIPTRHRMPREPPRQTISQHARLSVFTRLCTAAPVGLADCTPVASGHRLATTPTSICAEAQLCIPARLEQAGDGGAATPGPRRTGPGLWASALLRCVACDLIHRVAVAKV